MNQNKHYSQLWAMWGIIKASLRATRRNISSLVFGLVFPLVFIVIFGFIGNNSNISVKVAVDPASNINNPVYQAIQANSTIKIVDYTNTDDIKTQLSKGDIDGLVRIDVTAVNNRPHYLIDLKTSSSSQNGAAILGSFFGGIADQVNLTAVPQKAKIASFQQAEIPGRKYTSIDFLLPGMLGFSLLNSGIFATAFVFLTLKQTLVIKRFFTTPIKPGYIIVGEGISRLLVALLQATVLVLVGRFAFNYTLVHGLWTFLEMMVIAALGLVVFLGFGFIISSVAKDERTVAPLAQLFILPQFLLAGTFFPIDQFPSWLQPIGKVMPLSFMNDAMRKIAFEGASLANVWHQVLYLVLWIVGTYIVTARVFRWE